MSPRKNKKKFIQESIDNSIDENLLIEAKNKPMKKHNNKKLEKQIQNEIFLAIGSMENVLLFRNSVGLLDAVRSDGNIQRIKQGLGKGSPDLIGCLKLKNGLGQFFAIEVKRPGCKLRENQIKCHEKWSAFGIKIFTATSKEEAIEFMNNLINLCNHLE